MRTGISNPENDSYGGVGGRQVAVVRLSLSSLKLLEHKGGLF